MLHKFCCANIVRCNAMCSSHVSLFAYMSSKVKTSMKEMLNRLKRNFKRNIYLNRFCLMSQVLFFYGAGRWANGKRMKQNKRCLKKCDNTEFCWYDDIRCESKACCNATWTKRKKMNKLPKIYNWSDFLWHIQTLF